MPKVSDYKAYFRDIATKSGLADDKLQQVMGVMDDEKFAKAFTDGFKPLPDYSHDLDDVRSKTKAEKDAEYKTWHDGELKKYEEYVAVVNEHKAYKDAFGDLNNPMTNPNPNPNPNGGPTMTKEEINALLDTRMNEQLSRRDSAVMDLLEVRESHMNTFKKSLSVKEFETAWKEHPEWGGSLKIAYEKWVEPEIRKVETTAWEAKLAQAREEGIRDGYSRRVTPTDHQPKEFSVMFDRKEDVAKLSESDQERHSRSSFFEALNQKTPA